MNNKRRMATRSPTLVGREEQMELGLVFSFLLLEDNLQNEEEILKTWLPIAAQCYSKATEKSCIHIHYFDQINVFMYVRCFYI